MRKLVIGLLGLSLATVAQGQGATRSFDFKGIKAGDTYDQHTAEFRKCDKYMNFNGCRFKDAQVAGVYVGPEAGWGFDGKLMTIRGNFQDFSYDKIDAGFQQKWGKPDAYTEVEVQNGYGAKIRIPTSVWHFAEGDMTLIGPDFRHGCSFAFRTHAYQAYLDGLEKPKADF
jgi:hypothetical protein